MSEHNTTFVIWIDCARHLTGNYHEMFFAFHELLDKVKAAKSSRPLWLVEERDGERAGKYFTTHDSYNTVDRFARPPVYDFYSPPMPAPCDPAPVLAYTDVKRGPLDHLDPIDRWLAVNAPSALESPPNPHMRRDEAMPLDVARTIVASIEARDDNDPLTFPERRAVALVNDTDHEAGAGFRIGLQWTRKVS